MLKISRKLRELNVDGAPAPEAPASAEGAPAPAKKVRRCGMAVMARVSVRCEECGHGLPDWGQ